MARETRTIPFTAAQRATIRTTALLMLPTGLIMFTLGTLAIVKLLPLLQMPVIFPLVFAVQWLNALLELTLGICFFIAALALLSVAGTGTVDALLRGLRALCVVYVVKATLLVLAVAGMILLFLGVPLIL